MYCCKHILQTNLQNGHYWHLQGKFSVCINATKVRPIYELQLGQSINRFQVLTYRPLDMYIIKHINNIKFWWKNNQSSSVRKLRLWSGPSLKPAWSGTPSFPLEKWEHFWEKLPSFYIIPLFYHWILNAPAAITVMDYRTGSKIWYNFITSSTQNTELDKLSG